MVRPDAEKEVNAFAVIAADRVEALLFPGTAVVLPLQRCFETPPRSTVPGVPDVVAIGHVVGTEP